jgi:type I restriction enzyme M protein
VNPETYAITKADLLLKGDGDEAENFRLASVLSQDGFPAREFDFMLSNPPYGKSWKTDLERLGGKGGMKDPRFIIQHSGDSEYSLVTRSSDGQMLFLANMLSKMKQGTRLGSRVAEVHNGSSLFTGDAGQGESNIRRWIIENDWLEAIVALPRLCLKSASCLISRQSVSKVAHAKIGIRTSVFASNAMGALSLFSPTSP